MAVVVSSPRLFDAVADALAQRRRTDGHQFVLCSGRIAGTPVVVARPTQERLDPTDLLKAILEGHHPTFLLSAAEGESLATRILPGDIVIANRVVHSAGESLLLEANDPGLSGIRVGGISAKTMGEKKTRVAEDNVSLASDDWSWQVAVAAKEVSLPLVAACLVLEPTLAERSPEVDTMRQQTSLVGRAGVLAGMAWKKRSGFRKLWNSQEARWQATGRLVELVKHLAIAASERE